MKKAYSLIVIIMLLCILPAPTAAAPLEARQSFLTVGSWNLEDDLGYVGIQFAAYDVNWQILRQPPWNLDIYIAMRGLARKLWISPWQSTKGIMPTRRISIW